MTHPRDELEVGLGNRCRECRAMRRRNERIAITEHDAGASGDRAVVRGDRRRSNHGGELADERFGTIRAVVREGNATTGPCFVERECGPRVRPPCVNGCLNGIASIPTNGLGEHLLRDCGVWPRHPCYW